MLFYINSVTVARDVVSKGNEGRAASGNETLLFVF
jgi:hypothetical protein